MDLPPRCAVGVSERPSNQPYHGVGHLHPDLVPGVDELMVVECLVAVHESPVGKVGLDDLFDVEDMAGILQDADALDVEIAEAVEQNIRLLLFQERQRIQELCHLQ